MRGWDLHIRVSWHYGWKNTELTEDLGLNLGSTNSFSLDKSLHFSDPFSSFLVGSNNYSEL